jgi:transglutaminase-like putative cysteine protease
LALLRIRHRTQYLYNKPVQLGPHRLVLRPRESRDLRLTAMDISTIPPSSITWAGDVFGNAIATASFDAIADNLVIESTVTLELTSAAWPVFPITASAATYPFRYSSDERADLGALLQPQYLDPTQRLAVWARGFVHAAPTDTLSLLKDINAGVSATVCYQAREDEGTQSPSHTLNSARGSCRDMAVLFAESCRVLGFGARLVSGYLHNPASPMGTTHAWAEVFVPGAGWITFDPTNRSVGGHNLIPVAVARDIGQATPVTGSFIGMTDSFRGMWVEVSVLARTAPLRDIDPD